MPLPLPPASKRCVVNAWTTCQIDLETVSGWTAKFPSHGIGLRCGSLVAIDIDVLDADLSHQLYELAVERLGPTLMRVGRWPKRLLLYRTEQPFAKIVVGAEGRKLEVLARGQQFVAFGRHPDTGRDYGWPLGETPLEVALDSLPTTDETSCRALCNEAGSLLGVGKAIGGSRRRSESGGGGGEVVRDLEGRVVDGRDSWLSRIAFHTVHDAVAGGGSLDPEQLTQIAWERFTDSSDLSRPHGSVDYTPRDAARKVADKLRLLSEGRLPARDAEPAEASPWRTLACCRGRSRHARCGARRRLPDDRGMARSTPRAATRRRSGSEPPSASARASSLGITCSSCASGCARLACRPASSSSRPRTSSPRRRPRPGGTATSTWPCCGATKRATRSLASRCARTSTRSMPPSPQARKSTAPPVSAEPIAAPSSRAAPSSGTAWRSRRPRWSSPPMMLSSPALPSTPPASASSSIDEGCWRRAEVRLTCDWSQDPPSARQSRSRRSYERATSDAADLLDLSAKVTRAVGACGLGLLTARALRACRPRRGGLPAGFSAREEGHLQPRPLPRHAGRPASKRARHGDAQRGNSLRVSRCGRHWPSNCRTGREGRLRVLPGERLQVLGVKPIHITLQAMPVLHLDATLRPELARTVLPRLRVEEIEAAAPFMAVTLVAGSFGKSSLCPNPAVKPEEQRRRAEPARRVRRLRPLAGSDRGSASAARRHLPEHRGGVRRHPRRRGRALQRHRRPRPVPRCRGADGRSGGRCRRTAISCRWPAPSSAAQSPAATRRERRRPHARRQQPHGAGNRATRTRRASCSGRRSATTS